MERNLKMSWLEGEEERGTVEKRSYGDFGNFANTLDIYVVLK